MVCWDEPKKGGLIYSSIVRSFVHLMIFPWTGWCMPPHLCKYCTLFCLIFECPSFLDTVTWEAKSARVGPEFSNWGQLCFSDLGYLGQHFGAIGWQRKDQLLRYSKLAMWPLGSQDWLPHNWMGQPIFWTPGRGPSFRNPDITDFIGGWHWFWVIGIFRFLGVFNAIQASRTHWATLLVTHTERVLKCPSSAVMSLIPARKSNVNHRGGMLALVPWGFPCLVCGCLNPCQWVPWFRQLNLACWVQGGQIGNVTIWWVISLPFTPRRMILMRWCKYM